jgi:DNA-directed RNA polymerase specialized sigma24 family protein
LPEGDLRDIAVAKLDGFTNDEIAERLGVQTRTVERKLRTIRELWSGDALA